MDPCLTALLPGFAASGSAHASSAGKCCWFSASGCKWAVWCLMVPCDRTLETETLLEWPWLAQNARQHTHTLSDTPAAMNGCFLSEPHIMFVLLLPKHTSCQKGEERRNRDDRTPIMVCCPRAVVLCLKLLPCKFTKSQDGMPQKEFLL